MVEFRFVRRAVDWLGLALSLVTGCVVALYTVFPRHWRPRLDLVNWVTQREVLLRWTALIAIVGACILIVLRAQTRQHLLPANSIFHRVNGPDLVVRGDACTKNGPLTFQCQGRSLEAQCAPGSWGTHLCMATDERRPLTISLATKLGSALHVYTDTFADEGSVKVTVENQDLGTVMTRRAHTDWRVFQFDTRPFADCENARIRIEISGTALRCFDVRVVQ